MTGEPSAPSYLSRARSSWAVASPALALMFFTAALASAGAAALAGCRTFPEITVATAPAAVTALWMAVLAIGVPSVFGRPPVMPHLVIALPVLFALFVALLLRLVADWGIAVWRPERTGRPDLVWADPRLVGFVLIAQVAILAWHARAVRRAAAK